MGEQSSTRLEGDRYQHLYSWYEILRLLDPASPFESAVVEHPRAGAADDVTLHARQDTGVASRFTQVKWHVDQRSQYTFDGLTEAEAGSRSLLHKLFDSWRALRAQGPVEIWLVSNWSAAPHPDLGRIINSREWALLEEFFTATPRTTIGRRRSAWSTALGVSDEEMMAFCRDLRLRLGYSGIRDLEEQVDDRMRAFGLRFGNNPRAIARDEIAERIEEGGGQKVFTRADLIEMINARGLRAAAEAAPEVRLWVHGWARQAFDEPPSVELDWTRWFDRDTTTVPSPEDWTITLLPELRAVRDRVAGTPNGKYIDFRGKVPLTTALAVGNAFRTVAGYKFRVEQPTQSETFLWRSDAVPSGNGFARVHSEGDPGTDLLVGLGVTGQMLPAMQRLRGEIGASALVYFEPIGGAGQTAVRDAGHAAALAASARDVIQQAREEYGARRIHLVLYSPAGFALFLGQRLNALGAVVTYERSADGGYQQSVTLTTG